MMLSIDKETCVKYAVNYSKRKHKEFLKISPDGYISDGVYSYEVSHIEEGIEDYFYSKFNSEIQSIHDNYGDLMKDENDDYYCDEVFDKVQEVTEIIHNDKLFDKYRDLW